MEYLQYVINSIADANFGLQVLNLVISGIPSILLNIKSFQLNKRQVLNLVISGIPSIPLGEDEKDKLLSRSFKPCYKWNTFNTSTLW